MAWFLALASKMIGKEIPMILEVGMAPGGKIKKPKEEVEEYLQHFLIIADAMAKNKIRATSPSTPSSRRCWLASAPSLRTTPQARTQVVVHSKPKGVDACSFSKLHGRRDRRLQESPCEPLPACG